MKISRRLCATLLAVLATLTVAACGDDPEPPAAAESEGGEDTSTLEDAKRKADEAHERFKEEVKPAAEFVDEKTREVVDEGKELVGAGSEDDDAEQGEGEAEADAPPQ